MRLQARQLLISAYAPWWWMLGFGVGLSTLLRLALWASVGAGAAPLSGAAVLQVMGAGLAYDLLASMSLLLPLLWFLALCNGPRWHQPWGRAWLALGYGAWVFLLLCVAVSEGIFWDEFGTRFNFIAVDYLIYTHEVIGNIRESYPVGTMLMVLLLVSGAMVWLARGRLWCRPRLGGRSVPQPGTWRWLTPLGVSLVVALGHLLADASLKNLSDNRYLNALSGNGIYEFFTALRHNELDYAHFYQSLPLADALQRLRRQLPTPHSRLASLSPEDLTRVVDYGVPEKRLNVVLISVESLSADFMSRFGNQQGITPRLDALARQGLLLTQLYATGTRTVRGLEALSLSVPPTPGQSIVKRPGNEGLFSLGTVFRAKGYDTRYVYGGYGYFDNMNAFFSANDYQVVDRTAIPSGQVHHENIWGVADEDLFTLALAQADASHQAGRPSFMHVMTTTNHRPFTYPQGRIDIPSHQGRAGGVKYTDWAIGNFIDRAARRPWFKDTVFVIVADHCASSAGKTDLPVERYHIPAIIYSPAHVQPGELSRLASQIDVAPTLLGLLKFSYRSRFLGYDLFDLEPGRERAFIGTYQDLGFLDGKVLLRLDPRGQAEVKPVQDGQVRAGRASMSWDQVADAISWYQGAAWAYHHQGLSARGAMSGFNEGFAARR